MNPFYTTIFPGFSQVLPISNYGESKKERKHVSLIERGNEKDKL